MKEAGKQSLISLASAVPFRFGADGLEFCLITGRKSGKWGFPKGRIAKGVTPNEAALSEALEEAGLRGRIVGEPLGRFRYSRKGQKCRLVAMLMEVDECLDDWEESSERERRWVPAPDVAELLSRPNLIDLYRTAVEHLTQQPEIADSTV